MYPHIISSDGTITIVVGNTEHVVAPKTPNHSEILWCIENEVWESIPPLLEDRTPEVVAELDFSVREDMTREEAIATLKESIPDAQKTVDMLRELGVDINFEPEKLDTLSNDELREQLSSIGIEVKQVVGSRDFTRSEALKMLEDLDADDDTFTAEEIKEKSDRYRSMSNEDLRGELDLAGFLSEFPDSKVVDDPA